MNFTESTSGQVQFMQRFYRWQSAIYDATRWPFLFGRREILRQLPNADQLHLLEVGCGTGWNLKYLATHYPNWRFTGIDVSPDMLAQAAKATAKFGSRVNLIQQPYRADATGESPDLILFSYSLTMFNPGWEAAIEQARKDLKPGGHIAVVDFHDTRLPWFRRWMERNCVRMEGHLLPFLEARFQPEFQDLKTGYGGFWRYFMFIGKKKA